MIDKIIQGIFAQVLQGKSVIGTSRKVTGLEVPQEVWAVYAVFQKELFDWTYYYFFWGTSCNVAQASLELAI